MATDLERLVVSLEGKITSYEKAMNKALGITNTRSKQIENRLGKTELALRNFGGSAFKGFAAGALGALAPILSVAAAVQGAKAAMQEFGDVSDNAKAAGLDAEFFQGLAYQAQLGGVSMEAISAATAGFAKNSGLAVAGKGRMVTALKALNPALLENIRAATSQEQRIKLVSDALAKEEDASKRAAIATAVFGDAGAKLADVFAGGSAQIDVMQAKARDLGLIVGRELIAKADELGDEFDTATKILDLQLKQALINLGPLLVWLTGLTSEFARMAGTVFDSFNSIGNRGTATLKENLKALRDSMSQPIGFGGTLQGVFDPAAVKAEIARIEQEIFNRADKASMNQLTGTSAPATTDVPTLDEIESRNEAAAAAVKQGEAVKSLIADLQFERTIVGLSAEEQDIQNTIRRAGVDATSAQGKEIRALIESLNAEKDAQDKVNDALKQQAELAESAGRALANAFEDGKVTGLELLNILADVAKQFALMQLTNLNDSGDGNILTSLLSGILGGFATGTANTGGSRGQPRGIVHGQEAVIPLPNGGRVPVDIRLPAAAGAVSQKVVNNVFNYGTEKVEQRQNSTGGIDVIIAAAVSKVEKNMASGRYRPLGVGPGLKRT